VAKSSWLRIQSVNPVLGLNLLTLILEQHNVAGLIPAGQGRALAVRGPGKSKDLARLQICQLPRRTAINGLAPQV
jgi:hypothetical protein